MMKIFELNNFTTSGSMNTLTLVKLRLSARSQVSSNFLRIILNMVSTKLLLDCDKKFTSKFKLKRHILIHSQTKTFLCDVCHRAFRRKDHLRNHEKVHDPGKTIYTCTYDSCARTYNSVTSFRKHQVTCSVTRVASPKLGHKSWAGKGAVLHLIPDVTTVTPSIGLQPVFPHLLRRKSDIQPPRNATKT